jgi:nitrous oxidase accessory protein NosD
MSRWLVLLMVFPIYVQAATVEVPPGQSIQSALDQAGSGGTVRLQAGTYNETNLRPPSGVTIEGAGAIIRPTGTPAAGFEVSGSGVTIRNLVIDGSGGGISYGIRVSGTDNLIDGVEVANVQNQGIALYCPGDNHTGCGGGRNTVRNVYSHGAGSGGCHGTTAQNGYCHGIYMYSNDNVIEGGEFSNNNGYGIQTYGAHTVILGASVHDNADGHGVTIPGFTAFPDSRDTLVNWDGSSGGTVSGRPTSTAPAARAAPDPAAALPSPRNLRVLSLPQRP